jgi:glucose/arabinose dehydrogenase
MKRIPILAATLSPLLMAASCGGSSSTIGGGDPVSTPSPSPGAFDGSFAIAEHGAFDEPWASAFVPGTQLLFVTEKPGTAKVVDTATGKITSVSGLPNVDYGGQGGLGDVAFLQSEAGNAPGERTIYLSWAEAGEGDTRGAVVGRGQLVCLWPSGCSVEGLETIWRQTPKVTGRGHYSHRIVFSPDEQYMFVSSGDRQKKTPAQDTSNTLGSIVRLNLDGSAAAGNPLANEGSPSDEIWAYGTRNILSLDFDDQGRLWEIEHGPQGGDELNLVQRGANYGWPVRSNGINYDGSDIPDHSADDGFTKPVISWTPVIAPGNMIFYGGDLFSGMDGDLIVAGLKTQALIRIAFDGTNAREVARYDMGERFRQVFEGPVGALWAL